MAHGTFYTEKQHRIEHDTTGSGQPRLTCWTCNGKTLVRQPYMSDLRWKQAGQKFMEEHGAFKHETFVAYPLSVDSDSNHLS